MDAAARHLDTLAATQIIGDAEVAACWGLVREGIQMNKLGLGNLGRLIEQLRRGAGMGLDELSIEIDPPGSARAVVGRLDEVYGCPAAALIEELERLLARAGGATSAPSPSTPPPPASPPPHRRPMTASISSA